MNPKKLFFVVLMILSTTLIFAKSEKEKTGSLLWKISGNGLSKPSYILGTFHMKSKNYLDSIPGANAALKSCEQAIGELVMSDMMAMGLKMQQAAMMGPDTTFKTLYSEAEYQLVDSKLKSKIGVGLEQFGIYKPAMIGLTIAMMEYQKLMPSFNPMDGLDQYIQTKAVEDNKPVLGLETVEDQIYALFGSMSLKRQAEVLLCSLQNDEYSKKHMLELIDLYNQANLEKIIQLADDKDDPCPSQQEEENAMLKDRNDKWVKQLPALMKEKSSFIAVGALHLPGEIGLLQQLGKLGYKIEAVK